MRKAGWLLASQAPVSLFQHLPKRRRLPLTKGTGWQKGKHFYGILGILAATSFSTPFPFGVFASKTGWHSYGCHECQSMEVAPTSAAATAAVSQPASQLASDRNNHRAQSKPLWVWPGQPFGHPTANWIPNWPMQSPPFSVGQTDSQKAEMTTGVEVTGSRAINIGQF